MKSEEREQTQFYSAASLDQMNVVERATGIEIGIFSNTQTVLPESCHRSCAKSRESGDLTGVCPLVMNVAKDSPEQQSEYEGVCEKGYRICVRRGPDAQTRVLLLSPKTEQSRAAVPRTAQDELEIADAIWSHLDRTEQEIQGLSFELLRSFEQLNVLFDVTKEIGRNNDVSNVRQFLLRKIAEILSCDWSCHLSHDGESQLWRSDPCGFSLATVDVLRSEYGDEIRAVAEGKSVIVRTNGLNDTKSMTASLIFGPLAHGTEGCGVVVFGRRFGQPEFESGDMMILDCVLGYGENVITNLLLAERVKKMSFEAVRALVSAIDKKDTYTSGHSERVGFLSRMIGEEMNLSAPELQNLEWSGLLHDVGKIGIRDDIINKKGRLTDEEFAIIKKHPRMSHEVIEPFASFEGVREAVLYHHETPDGTGYPEGLSGDSIPLGARIVHVADTFDALTSDRSYRQGNTVEMALEIIQKDTGTKLDIETVRAFERALLRFRTEQPDRFQKIFAHIKDVGS